MHNQARWKTKLHLMPPAGWLNDPNGLCRFGGLYHVFFQYRPDNASGTGNTGWGHYTSPDLLHWTFQGMPLRPDQPFDRDGVYSGSALADETSMRLFYTGNVKHPGNFDYIDSGREANVALVESRDGMSFGKKELLLQNHDYPDLCTCHVRDPKVWRDGDDYYMVLGARFRKDGRDRETEPLPHETPEGPSRADYGGVLLYHSRDCRLWKYLNTLTTREAFGYMWECPDTFFLGGIQLLSISPQGLGRESHRFQNIYQSGYFTVTGELAGDYALSDFTEWDMGFDFYAPQTFLDGQGRRILIGWMGLPDIEGEYANPTVEDGWQHILTIPREVFCNEAGAVCQRPAAELESLRKREYGIKDHQTLKLGAPFDLLIRPGCTDPSGSDTVITLFGSLRICCSSARGEYSMTFLPSPHCDGNTAGAPGPGCGRTVRRAKITAAPRQIRLICDTSAVEIFFGDGETVMSTRVYPDPDAPATVTVDGGSGSVWEMG